MSFLSRIFGQREEALPPRGDPVRIAQVLAVLEELRPMLLADGGDLRLVAVEEDGSIELALIGACARCSVRTLTLQGGIEPRLRQRLPWVRAVRG